MLKGHVFLYQIFANEICAKVFDTLGQSKNGILKGFGNEMEVTYNGTEVTVSSGVAMVGGRPVQETSTDTLDAGTTSLFCILCLTIDLDAENTTSQLNQAYYEIVTGVSDYPSLTQDDIVNNQSGKYQFELARFTTGVSGIDDFVDTRSYINIGNIINNMDTLEDQTINAPSIAAVKNYISNLYPYSNTEKVVGTWFDKPLYRKDYNITSISNQDSVLIDTINNVTPVFIFGQAKFEYSTSGNFYFRNLNVNDSAMGNARTTLNTDSYQLKYARANYTASYYLRALRVSFYYTKNAD